MSLKKANPLEETLELSFTVKDTILLQEIIRAEIAQIEDIKEKVSSPLILKSLEIIFYDCKAILRIVNKVLNEEDEEL